MTESERKEAEDPHRSKLELGKDRVIDLPAMAKAQDPELSRWAQSFIEVATAAWFRWLGWLFAAGGVAYLAEVTGDRALRVVALVSQLLLALYMQFFIISIRIEPLWSR